MRVLIPVDGSAHGTAAVAFVASRSTLIGAQPEVERLNVQLPMPPRAARGRPREGRDLPRGRGPGRAQTGAGVAEEGRFARAGAT